MLKQICDAGSTGEKDGERLCTFYIAGIADGLFLAPILASQGRGGCLTEMPSGIDAVVIVRAYMRQHPEVAKLSAAVMAAVAISEAYPCKPK